MAAKATLFDLVLRTQVLRDKNTLTLSRRTAAGGGSVSFTFQSSTSFAILCQYTSLSLSVSYCMLPIEWNSTHLVNVIEFVIDQYQVNIAVGHFQVPNFVFSKTFGQNCMQFVDKLHVSLYNISRFVASVASPGYVASRMYNV